MKRKCHQHLSHHRTADSLTPLLLRLRPSRSRQRPTADVAADVNVAGQQQGALGGDPAGEVGGGLQVAGGPGKLACSAEHERFAAGDDGPIGPGGPGSGAGEAAGGGGGEGGRLGD